MKLLISKLGTILEEKNPQQERLTIKTSLNTFIQKVLKGFWEWSTVIQDPIELVK